MPESNFSALDWTIVAFYLLGTVLIGFYVNRRIRGMSDFLVAGRSIRTRLGIATMIGSELGLVTAMFAAQKGFTGGFAAFHIGVLALVAALVVGFTGMIVVPLREMKVMTIPEFYEKRFSRKLRIFGGLILALSGILNMGLFLKAGAIFVTGLTGMNDPTTIKIVMTVMIVLVLAYTTLGGMVSVVLTDFIQFVVLSIGLLVAVGLAISTVGWSNIVDGVETVHGSAGFDPLNDDGFGLSYVVWMFFVGLISCNVWQTAVMRACSAESTAVVKKLYIWSSIGFMVRFIIPQFLGICALAYFLANPELAGYFFEADGTTIVPERSLEAMPVFLSQLLPIGVIGLVGAGMLAAFMSTHDTYLLCWSSVLVEDVINPLTKNKLAAPQRILLTRVFLVLIAGFLLIWSMWYKLEDDLWDYMAVSGAVYFIGAFVVLTAGIYWRRASSFGAWLALLAGTVAILGLSPVQGVLGLAETFKANKIGSAQVGLSACATAAVLMVVGSLVVPDKRTSEEGV